LSLDPGDPVTESLPRSIDVRVWCALALLNLVALFASIPYEDALLRQGPVASQVSPAMRLGVGLALLIAITWPAIALGLRLGRGLGLGAPWIAGALRGERPARAPFGWAAGLGVATGVVLLVTGGVLESAFQADFAPLSGFAPPTPWAGLLGAFGAGIAEETWLRLIVLTGVAALGQVLVHPQRDPAQPRLPGRLPEQGILWTANVLAALVFGALHFGNLQALGAPLTPVLAGYILLFNGIVGLLCGWLYWTRGLEAAIVCHIAVDVVLHAVGPAAGGLS